MIKSRNLFILFCFILTIVCFWYQKSCNWYQKRVDQFLVAVSGQYIMGITQKEIYAEQRRHTNTHARGRKTDIPYIRETHVAYISITPRHHTPYRKHHSAGALSDCLRSLSPVPPNASTICLTHPAAIRLASIQPRGHLLLVAASGHFASEGFPPIFPLAVIT